MASREGLVGYFTYTHVVCFVLIILYSLYLEYDSPLIPPPPGWPARWRSSTPATRRPTYTHVRVWSYGRKFDHFDNTDSLQYLGIETRG